MNTEEIQRKINSIVLGLSGNEDEKEIFDYLYKLKTLVEGEFNNSLRLTILTEVWKFKLPQKILSFLKEKDYSVCESAVKTCHLCSILVDCCIGYSIATSQVTEFIPNLTYTLQSCLSKMLTDYNKIEKSSQPILCGNISWIVTILGRVCEHFISSSITMMSSKHFMQFLMAEDPSISLIALSYLQNLLKINKDIFFHVAESRANSIMEELTFKLFGSAEDRVAKKSLSVLLFMLDVHPSLLEIFSTKRYRGFKTYVAKLQGKGFDVEIKKMLSMLDAQSKRLLATQKDENAAIIIQSCYRGHRLRKKLKRAVIAIVKFQRIYRRRKTDQYLQTTKLKLDGMKTQIIESDRRKAFLNSRMKQLKTIENIPAKTVDRFLEDHEDKSAKRIQAAWKGYCTRKVMKQLQPEMRKEKAAITIQRQIRKWLQYIRSKRIHNLIELLPSGLNDERKVELQKVVGNIRNRFPVACKNDTELHELHDKSFRMLNNHMMNLNRTRRNDERRKALMAQLAVLSSQLSYYPSLDTVNLNHVDEYASHSTPVIVAARQKHLDCLNEQKLPWWKKLEKENAEYSDNSYNEFVLNDEKQF